MKRRVVLALCALFLWQAPAAAAQIPGSSEHMYPVTAIDPAGRPQLMAVGSSDTHDLTVFTLQGEKTNWALQLFQDGTIHLVPREDKALTLADDLTATDPQGPSSTGIVPIPEQYIYDPFAFRKGLHDYCTSAPNFYVTPELNADFRGACANHDMCMEDVSWFESGVSWCNAALLLDMRAVCHSVYVSELEKHQQGCRDTAELYYNAVTLANWSKL